MPGSHRQPWEAPADGDFARYVEQLGAGAAQQGAHAPAQALPPGAQAPQARLPGIAAITGRPARASGPARGAHWPRTPLSALLAAVRRLLLMAGFGAVALSPLLGMRLWPLALPAVALWLVLGRVAARLDPARRSRPARTRRSGGTGAIHNLTQPRDRHHR